MVQSRRPPLDVYALGVILGELVSGQRPLPGVERGARANESRRQVFQSKWHGIVTRCLDQDPRRRFTDGEALRQAVRPPLARRWALGAVTAAVLAASLSGAVTFQRLTAPKQTVRLAVLPFRSGAETANAASVLLRDTTTRLAALKSTAQTKVISINGKELALRKVDTVEKAGTTFGAIYVLHGELLRQNPEKEKQYEVLHVYLTDAQSGVNRKEWTLKYEPGQLRYAPVALAGIVTNSLDLPPMMMGATVNATAQADYSKALRFLKRGVSPDDALVLLERVVMIDPDAPLGYAGLAEAQSFKARLTGDPRWTEKAHESVRQAELRNSDLPAVHMISGWLEKTSGHYELAEEHFLRVIKLEPGNSDAWRRLGDTYDKSGRANEALRALKKSIQLEPDEFRNHRELGIFYYYHDRSAEALAEYRTLALSGSPTFLIRTASLAKPTTSKRDIRRQSPSFRLQ